MKRWHDELAITTRNWRKHRKMHVEQNLERGKVGQDPFEVECVCNEQAGRFRKMDAYDCGNSRCYLCNHGKFPKRTPTCQEFHSTLSLKEQLQELHEREDHKPTDPTVLVS